jgi:hypothetical protein
MLTCPSRKDIDGDDLWPLATAAEKKQILHLQIHITSSNTNKSVLRNLA